jgi:hypothetical protein
MPDVDGRCHPPARNPVPEAQFLTKRIELTYVHLLPDWASGMPRFNSRCQGHFWLDLDISLGRAELVQPLQTPSINARAVPYFPLFHTHIARLVRSSNVVTALVPASTTIAEGQINSSGGLADSTHETAWELPLLMSVVRRWYACR